MNSIPLDGWERAAGYVCSGANVYPFTSRLKHLLAGIGVRTFSCSQCVSLLKACARMVAEHRGTNVKYTRFQEQMRAAG